MNTPSDSFLKVYYELRPSKQVERRMLVHSLIDLNNAGINISNYTYCGMGSIFFTDYILFHKYLGINNMISVEYSDNAKKRAFYNKPYDFIDLKFENISDTVANLKNDKKYFLWLDFDDIVNDKIINTLNDSIIKSPEYSIILITLDAEQLENTKETYEYYRELFDSFFDSKLSIEDFKNETLSTSIQLLISNIIKNAIQGSDLSPI